MLDVLTVVVEVLLLMFLLGVLLVMAWTAWIFATTNRRTQQRHEPLEYMDAVDRHPSSRGTAWTCLKCGREFPTRFGSDSLGVHYSRYHRAVPIGPDDMDEKG
jgi:hypothetical protein